MIGRLDISYPSKGEQIKIATILKTLDNKITLNRQINQTLEQMAQALFKSWFVDFDPVVDNALDAGFFEQELPFSDELLRRAETRRAVREHDGFKPLPDAIRQLFPATFEECAEPSLGLGGWVPKGWIAGALGDVLSLRNERTKPSAETKNLPYVPVECIGTKEPFLSEFKSGDEAMSSLILFKKGDILFGAMRPYFHKVCIAPFDGVTRSTVFTLTARDTESRYFSLFQAYQESTIEYATLHSEGSTIPYAKWRGSLERQPTILPTIQLQRLFHEKIKLFIEWGGSNNEQSKTLSKLRDTLLPKLISGELRLDNIETDLTKVEVA
ncbi:restriction modification system DNA specificity domain-containing protein [Aeromonas molluscorum 848]|uniref:Restriction modification system DNA specificity domain-containing protein n=2 Tax=Aeromonas molluscorum TaxID=271417 RepID=R1H2E0_9GAMM|nr:restriction modification system DNA specificity domain-containing protein [Aeromonas molluscorum 848]